jgi:hypothetical protein
VPVLFHLLDVSPRPPQTPAALPPSTLEAESEEPSGAQTPAGPGDSNPSAEIAHSVINTPPAPRVSPPPMAPPPNAPSNTASNTAPSTALNAPSMPCVDLPAPAAPPVALEIPAEAAVVIHPQMPDEGQPSASAGSAGGSAAATTDSAQVASPAQAVSEPATPRQRARPLASEDWLASHGKFIALGFLVALCATIYLARTRRQHRPAETAQATSPAPLIDEPLTVSIPSATAPTSSSRVATTPMADTSPANLVEAASATSESKVELHPPTASPLLAPPLADGKDSSGTGAGSKDNLFNFPATDKTEERLAARSNPATPGSAATSPPGSVPETPSSPTAPDLSPAYPTTSAPMPSYPVTTSAPVAYPTTQAPSAPAPPLGTPSLGAPPAASSAYASLPPGSVAVTSGYNAVPPQAALPQPGMTQPGMTQPGMTQPGMPPGAMAASVNYRSAYAPAMPAAAPSGTAPAATAWAPAAPGGMVPPQYQPTTNTATGPRYERTGSGNY